MSKSYKILTAATLKSILAGVPDDAEIRIGDRDCSSPITGVTYEYNEYGLNSLTFISHGIFDHLFDDDEEEDCDGCPYYQKEENQND